MKTWWLHAFVVCASLITGYLIYTHLIVPGGPLSWDEASHALYGLTITYDLQQGDWVGFIYDTYRQVYWPPIHSWLTGIGFLIAGPGAVTARTVSLLAFIMIAPTLYLAARQMRQQQRELAGVIAAALFLTSPPLVSFAALSMLEVPGLLAMTVTFLIYFKLTGGDASRRMCLLLGLAVTLTYFVKSNYGILVFMAIVISQLIDTRFHVRPLLTRCNLYAVLPMVIIFPVWFAYPPKLIATWRFLVNYPVGVTEPFGVSGWSFYPLAFFRLSGDAWLFGLLLASLLAAFRFRRDKNVRFLLVFVLTQLVIGQLHHTKLDRHIFPILPALFLLAGYLLAEWWCRSRRPKKILQFWLPRLLTGALCLNAINLFSVSLHPPPADDSETISGMIATAVRETGITLIIGTRDVLLPNPPRLDWQLITQEQVMQAPRAGSVRPIEEERKIAAALTRYPLPAWLSEKILAVV
ncbi:MAG: glycosyltransferase family 39 protein, partial [candidate division NC10 bacterium]|nr:glycosyltransferase family 39 protein [candidate division NC10 bacterium]